MLLLRLLRLRKVAKMAKGLGFGGFVKQYPTVPLEMRLSCNKLGQWVYEAPTGLFN